MTRRLAIFGLALAAAVLAVSLRPARAATAQNTLTVSATVLGACTISPATLAFGSYDPNVATDRDAQGSIAVQCTTGSTYWIGLGLGANANGTTRQMAGGSGERLRYELYRDAGRQTVWDNANPDAALYTYTAGTVAAGLSPYSVAVYGRIPAGQIVSTGAFGDAVTMTINF